MKDLTIAIPTYNRKERLIREIKSLIDQPQFPNVSFLILDNHSNYDVKQVLLDEFGGNRLKNMQFISHPYNLGLSLNIALPFYYCKTKWLWIVSDDDECLSDALNIVTDDMRQYPDMMAIKYSIANMGQFHNEIVSNFDELIRLCNRTQSFAGEFMFISNGIYNLEKLQDILGDVINYSYNIVAGVNPILFGIDKNLGSCLFSEKRIVNYLTPASGTGWDPRNVMTRCANLLDYPFNCDTKTMIKLNSLISGSGFRIFMSACERFNNRKKAKLFYNKTFNLLYGHYAYFAKCFCKLIFYIFLIFGINIVKR